MLTERIRQTGEAPHVHSHVEILTFHVAGADMFVIRRTDDVYALSAKTLCRAVALLSFGIVAEYLHQLRVVNVFSERIRDGIQVHLMAIRGQLDSVRQAAFNVPKELRRTPGIPPSYQPRNDQLGLRFNRRERPNVAAYSGFQLLFRNVLLLAADETPDFVNLDPLRGNVAYNAVLIVGTGRADAHQQAKNRAFRHARHADCRPNGAAFDQCRDDRYFLRRVDYVCHNQSIRQRFRMVKRKAKKDRSLSGFLRFRPTRFGSFPRASSALFVGHGFKAALAADLPSLGPHLPHDLLSDGELNGLCGFDGFQENAPGVLGSIKSFCSAFALWHTLSVARMAEFRQGHESSNGPTTRRSVYNRYWRPSPRSVVTPTSNKPCFANTLIHQILTRQWPHRPRLGPHPRVPC